MSLLQSQTRWRTVFLDGDYVVRGKLGQVALTVDGKLDVWVCDWTNTDSGMKRSHRRGVHGESLGWTAQKHYDDGALFIRPFSDLDAACRLILAPRKRHMSPESRLANAARLATMRSRIGKVSKQGPTLAVSHAA